MEPVRPIKTCSASGEEQGRGLQTPRTFFLRYAVFLGADAEDAVVMKALITHLRSPMPDGWIEQVCARTSLGDASP